jgi:hypothetical protein
MNEMAADETPDIHDLIVELEQLLVREKRLSEERRRLHERIDRGYLNEITIRREVAVSAERRDLHRRIDELRAELRRRDLRRDPLTPLAEVRHLHDLGL